MNLAERLEQSLSELDCPVQFQSRRIRQRVIQYLLLIEKWNKQYNLTAIRTIETMLYRHVMDSLSIISYINGPKIVDVGSGAGLPGMPLAIARPDWQIILVESNQKKAAFLQQVKIELGLANIAIASARIEGLSPTDKINTIISRAYASLGVFVKTTRHLVSPEDIHCRWLAMKSRCADRELEEVSAPFFIENKIPLAVPGLSARRELIIIGQSAQLPKLDRG
ncbi:16S rRNA (guanine527-N7)-methyltransferase [Nitrosomonas sp. Nm51]|uniref:16S rRNA (guanine(527)-N(7))-methyltransferase RsmG n=1 Tax=Nitrosomonas sp. Nm51 TaxID=133720 RepID=UPI0008B2C519|nr:16S rRNA (guanine(527)-N(7))-methyltransferase RsmG [Nitrosomonas sp. Nm51]SER44439.1 16S rRNA (guanine527-N7)-methyltransferase [Nitrosomonas sp. Nm51]